MPPHRLDYQEDGQEEDLPRGAPQFAWDVAMTVLALGLVSSAVALVIVGALQLLSPVRRLL